MVSGEAKPTILLVEDDGSTRKLLSEIFEDQGWEVVTCSDGESALKRYRSGPDTMDVILTDLNLPGLTGVTVAEAIQAENPSQVIVGITGDVYNDATERFRKSGFTRILTKPIDLRVLIDLVEQFA